MAPVRARIFRECYFFVSGVACTTSFPRPVLMLLHHTAAPVSTVWTYGTRTPAVEHVKPVHGGAVGTAQQRGMEVPAELDEHEVVFPASWAVICGVLNAH